MKIQRSEHERNAREPSQLSCHSQPFALQRGSTNVRMKCFLLGEEEEGVASGDVHPLKLYIKYSEVTRV